MNNYEGKFAGVLYLIIYILSTFGLVYSFISVQLKQLNSLDLLEFKDYTFLRKANPLLVFIIIINFLSMAGIPPLSGFISKFFVFEGLIELNNLRLVVILILMSLISAYYYIRPIKILLFSTSKRPKFFDEISFSSSLIILIFFFFNLCLVLEPYLLFDLFL